MTFTTVVGKQEKTQLAFSRNWLTGRMSATVNGVAIALNSPWSPATHFTMALRRSYEFTVGQNEKHQIRLEHVRPLLLAGFRPQTYRVYVDDALVEERRGF